MFFLALGLVLISLVFLVYLLYYILLYGAKGRMAKYLEGIQKILETGGDLLPSISVIISTYEEAKVIRRKLANITASDYPTEKMEIIVIDDASKDGTAEIAERAFVEFGLTGRVIGNSQRIGLNASLNAAIEAASNNVLCITDSDVTFEKSALRNVVLVLEGMTGVGGVTGNIVPSFDDETHVTRLEESYRSFSNKSMLAESFRHSAFPGSGVLTAFKRSALSNLIPVDYGSTDGNISMSIIKGGYRFLYVPYADVYEPVPKDVGQHRLQKIRRAKRLIQVILHNTDVLFNKKYGEFGLIIFPLKFAMLVFCPLLISIGLLSLILYVILAQNIILYTLLALFLILVAFSLVKLKRIGSLLSGFVLHQFYLVAGLFSSLRKSTFWKKIERK